MNTKRQLTICTLGAKPYNNFVQFEEIKASEIVYRTDYLTILMKDKSIENGHKQTYECIAMYCAQAKKELTEWLSLRTYIESNIKEW